MEPSDIEKTIAGAFVQSWDQHIGFDGSVAIMNALSKAGYKIVRKDMIEEMLERVKGSTAAQSQVR